MKNITVCIRLTALLILGSVVTTSAQNSDLTEQLRAQLERTEEVIIKAREVVLATRSAPSKVALDRAVNLQDQARHWFRQGPGGGNYKRAGEMTFKARELAQKAISAGRLTAQNENVLIRKLEQADELLHRIRTMSAELNDNASSTAFNEGILQTLNDNLTKAKELYRSQHYRAALKLANQVILHAEKLLKAIQQGARNQGNYQRRIESVGQVIERSTEILSDCNSALAEQFLNQARETHRFAREMADAGRYDAALKSLQSAHELALKAGRECQGHQHLQQKYDRIRSQADQLAGEVNPGDDVAANLLNQINDQLRLAKEQIGQDHPDAAVAALKAAQMTLERLKTYLSETEF